jgi:valyl-tRNA synthetase
MRHESIMIAPYPTVRETLIVPDVEENFAILQDIVTAIRTIRGELRISPSTKITAGVRADDRKLRNELEIFKSYIERLAGLGTFAFDEPRPHGSASAVVRGMEVYVPLGGLIDIDAERQRLSKETERLSKLIETTRAKLGNESFVERAKPDVVELERKKLEDSESALVKVEKFLSELESLQ